MAMLNKYQIEKYKSNETFLCGNEHRISQISLHALKTCQKSQNVLYISFSFQRIFCIQNEIARFRFRQKYEITRFRCEIARFHFLAIITPKMISRDFAFARFQRSPSMYYLFTKETRKWS